jgi:hypothetical protein
VCCVVAFAEFVEENSEVKMSVCGNDGIYKVILSMDDSPSGGEVTVEQLSCERLVP